MAETVLRAWWERIRGRLKPRPMPYTLIKWLDIPGRTLVAGAPSVLAEMGIGAGQRVLEIGPGTGFYSIEAARRVSPTGHLVCVDVQHRMLARIREKLAAGSLDADLVQSDAAALPLASGQFDHVFMVGVLGEIPNHETALAEIRRVLKAGGRLSVSEQLPDPDFIPPATLRRELSAAGFVEEQTRGWAMYTSTWRLTARALADRRAAPE